MNKQIIAGRRPRDRDHCMYTDDRRSRGQSERINFLSVHLAAAASFVIERRKLNSTRLLQSAVNYLSIPHFWTSASNSVNLHKALGGSYGNVPSRRRGISSRTRCSRQSPKSAHGRSDCRSPRGQQRTSE